MIDNLGQQYTTPYNIKEQKIQMKRHLLEYLSSTDKNNSTNTLLKNTSTKTSTKRDTAEFSSESMSLLKSTNSSSADNTAALDFGSGDIQYDYTTKMYTLSDGTTFPSSTIHQVDKNSCPTLTAVDNNLIFNSNTYYNYSEVNGDTWLMGANKECVYQAPSDSDLGDYSTEEIAAAVTTFNFFSSLIIDDYPVGLEMFYSRDEVLDVMKNVGISPGKFTIGIDDKVRTCYLTNDGTILSDEQVSNYRNALNQANVFERGYTKDDVWLVDGVEIRPDEQGHLNIPDNLGANIKVIRNSKTTTD